MSIIAHIVRAVFIFLGLLAGIGAFALLVTDVNAATTNGSSYNCDTVLSPTIVDPDRRCDPPLQTRAQGAQALGTVALGAFVAGAAVSIGGRHRIAIQPDGRLPHVAGATPPGYSSPGYQQPPPGYQQAPPGYQQPGTNPPPSTNPPPR